MPRPEGHNKWNPSGASQWVPCPFSKNCGIVEVDRKTDASIAGDEAHEFCAEILVGNLTLQDVPAKYAVGVEMFTTHVLANNAPMMVERNFQSFEVEDHGGTLDVLMVEDRTAVLYDYTNGGWNVPIANNPQMLCYSGLVNEHFDVDQFVCTIIQPNGWKGPKIKQTTFSKAKVEDYRLEVIEAVGSMRKEPGTTQCRWCHLRMTNQCEEGVRFGRAKGWK